MVNNWNNNIVWLVVWNMFFLIFPFPLTPWFFREALVDVMLNQAQVKIGVPNNDGQSFKAIIVY